MIAGRRWQWGLRAAFLLILSLLLDLTACATTKFSPAGRPSSGPSPDSRQERLVAALQETIALPLSRVLVSGDRSAAESLLSSDAGEAAKALLLTAAPANSGLLGEVVLRPGRPAPAKGLLHVDLRGHFRYLHFDGEFPLRFQAVLRREQAWRIVDLDASDPPPWVLSHPLKATNSGRSVIVHPPGQSVDELAPLAEAAGARLAGKAPGDDGRYLLVLPAPGEAEEEAGLEDEDARVIFGWVWKGRRFVPSAPPYLAVKPRWLDGASRAERRRLMRHEMTHLALSRDTMPFAPLWLQEGLAMHFSEDLPLAVLREGRHEFAQEVNLLALTRRNRSFRAFDVNQRRVAYRYSFSAAAVDNLVGRFGEERVLDFLFAYRGVLGPEEIDRVIQAKGSVAEALPVFSVSATRRLLRQKFSETIDGLDAQVRARAAAP